MIPYESSLNGRFTGCSKDLSRDSVADIWAVLHLRYLRTISALNYGYRLCGQYSHSLTSYWSRVGNILIL
jgi:hypothetical protein